MEESIKLNKPKSVKTATTKSVKTATTKSAVKLTKLTSVKKKENVNPADPFPITLNKQEIKRVIDLFTGTKTTPKTPIHKIAEVLKINKKQVFRVLHKNELKKYKESSLK
jgi:hypothetical protein